MITAKLAYFLHHYTQTFHYPGWKYIIPPLFAFGTQLAQREGISKKEFLQALKGVLGGAKKDTGQMISNFIYKMDGKSADRVVNNLINIVNSK